jgi:hypothetical protein
VARPRTRLRLALDWLQGRNLIHFVVVAMLPDGRKVMVSAHHDNVKAIEYVMHHEPEWPMVIMTRYDYEDEQRSRR